MKIIKSLTVVSLLISLFTLTACNTVQGVGQDISCGGKALKRAAS